MAKLVVLAALVAAATALVPVHRGDGTGKDNAWIVVFKQGVSDSDRNTHIAVLDAIVAKEDDSTHDRTFDIMNFHGYSGVFSEKVLNWIHTEETIIDYIHADTEVRATLPAGERVDLNVLQQKAPLPSNDTALKCAVQDSATWGLVRIDERDLKITGDFNHDDLAGNGVDAYIIDTGIYAENQYFAKRAFPGADFTGEGPGDQNGHGTHVAGTVGADTYGVARGVDLIEVKVLGKTGSGSTSGVIGGIEYVCKQIEAKEAEAKKSGKKAKKCVSNMSLGGGFNLAMNAAVDATVLCGCTVVVAAGNSAMDACLSSPASAKNAFCVGSTDNTDSMSYFSNHGDCVDIMAPGSSITSTWIGGPSSINTISGTSMAAPHVAGVVASALYTQDLTPAQVKEYVVNNGSKDKLGTLPQNTPNNLVYDPLC